MPDLPYVSIIIPCRNEADFISKCIQSVLDCDYPKDKLEVLVIDGISTDGTREEIEKISKQNNIVRLLDNPQKIVPTAMNIGIRQTKGEIVIRIDGHAEVPNDFIMKNVNELIEHREAWCVGGPIESVNQSFVGKAIAAAMSSPVGVGNAMFRLGNFKGYVDTIAFGAYWKWVFDKIGLFDEELVRNQDDELNYRLVRDGGKIWMTPEIKSKYYTRTSLKKLWRQYFQYGFWRIRTMQKHKRPATLRQLAPLLLAASILLLSLCSLFYKPIVYLLLLELVVYILGLFIGFIDVARKSNIKLAMLSPVIFIILHFAYGLGCLWGIVRFILFGGKWMPNRSNMKLSR